MRSNACVCEMFCQMKMWMRKFEVCGAAKPVLKLILCAPCCAQINIQLKQCTGTKKNEKPEVT